MEDHNSEDAIFRRDNQENPIVMYLIVKESLGMGMGKTAAQVGHAVQMLHMNYSQLNSDIEGYRLRDVGICPDELLDLGSKHFVYKKWLETSFRKVVLRAKDKDWDKLKALRDRVVVVDSGLTEIAPGSETVIGLWPMYRSYAPKIVQKLQVLK